jgi:predicted secreted hydrolase
MARHLKALAALTFATVLAGCGASAPRESAQTTSTEPPSVRVARPGDDAGHPGARTEWWYVHAIDPETARTVVASFFSAPLPLASGFLYTEDDMTDWAELTARRRHSGPGVTLAAGGVSYDPGTRRWLVEQTAGGYHLTLTLTNTVPGTTAGPLRFGNESETWTVPVATGRADGEVTTPDGQTIEIRGWRAYHDHNWGAFDLESSQYDGWEWAAVHEEPGNAALLGGVNLLDGSFQGILVRATPQGTTACRPTLEREDWTTLDGLRYPTRVRARCAGRDVTFTVTRPYVVRGGSKSALTESVGETGIPGSIGLIEHLAPVELGAGP